MKSLDYAPLISLSLRSSLICNDAHLVPLFPDRKPRTGITCDFDQVRIPRGSIGLTTKFQLGTLSVARSVTSAYWPDRAFDVNRLIANLAETQLVDGIARDVAFQVAAALWVPAALRAASDQIIVRVWSRFEDRLLFEVTDAVHWPSCAVASSARRSQGVIDPAELYAPRLVPLTEILVEGLRMQGPLSAALIEADFILRDVSRSVPLKTPMHSGPCLHRQDIKRALLCVDRGHGLSPNSVRTFSADQGRARDGSYLAHMLARGISGSGCLGEDEKRFLIGMVLRGAQVNCRLEF